MFKKLHGMHHTLESVSTVCIIPQTRLRGVHHAAESESTVFITPQSQENKLSLKNSAKSESKLFWSLVTFKGTIR